ncbi:hypothetical protein Dshi_3225 [Dinoroseobacter shibae DFL 12 = DSM 16493]|jgi:7-cyano-7-deazaguanine synthase in queuosine biosynthesis|uniref:7-cyano-7-deazaguanine synthase n=1 Tax=Dinoroseobacter shibae (strain DSM 16493 / NCIMB 14021 / DFL 12) TaxID=398580 RepID=A8LMN3_DINSH|nr:7-cyano-7-deazaguanine synthase [Dinoroseobacter shibae]ABV94958.1 hypothetical protein Dshi_3225 [Dinoroseobacter shibae DFL 12 = DSM 16493]URF46378.1 7-cyano-7-deazaguanine synthase [Dinoroseobacter shibae]URF50684.1 7-cyano-7-deazaguanine synthase [Dinoroseobacter shibae]
MFLTGDRFAFTFTEAPSAKAPRSPFFKFDKESSWQATRVLMFSGGLDSLSGAVEEIAEHGQRVALVSHFSATKIAPVQRYMQRSLADAFGANTCQHVPVQVQMMGRSLKEGTHRSRSFLFAALGAITAEAFDLNRVSFHENGVVSLNLPPVGNVLGTRATRTTHPQTLSRFTALLGQVFQGAMRVDNPYFWRTKKEVVETIARLNMAEQIAVSRSCADVHNQTRQHPHCGRCSQCIDRLEGSRTDVRDREIALSYVRNAQAFEYMTPEDLERSLPAVLDAVMHVQQPPETALDMIRGLLARHGSSVAGVMRKALDQRAAGSFPAHSLPRLYGEMQTQVLLPTVAVAAAPAGRAEPETIAVEIDGAARWVRVGPHITFQRDANADLLLVLAESWLSGAGQGLTPLDYPCISAPELARRLGLESEEALRRRVLRARNALQKKFASSGLDADATREIIENVPWQGYRLAPDRVTVRRRVDKG